MLRDDIAELSAQLDEGERSARRGELRKAGQIKDLTPWVK